MKTPRRPNSPRPLRAVPLWVSIVAVIVVAIICIIVTVGLMRQNSRQVDSELAGEVNSYEVVTNNVIPSDTTATPQ